MRRRRAVRGFADTTYLGRLFNLSAHSPLRDSRCGKPLVAPPPQQQALGAQRLVELDRGSPFAVLVPDLAGPAPGLGPPHRSGLWTIHQARRSRRRRCGGASGADDWHFVSLPAEASTRDYRHHRRDPARLRLGTRRRHGRRHLTGGGMFGQSASAGGGGSAGASIGDGFPDPLGEIDDKIGFGLTGIAGRADLADGHADGVIQPGEPRAPGTPTGTASA